MRSRGDSVKGAGTMTDNTLPPHSSDVRSVEQWVDSWSGLSLGRKTNVPVSVLVNLSNYDVARGVNPVHVQL